MVEEEDSDGDDNKDGYSKNGCDTEKDGCGVS